MRGGYDLIGDDEGFVDHHLVIEVAAGVNDVAARLGYLEVAEPAGAEVLGIHAWVGRYRCPNRSRVWRPRGPWPSA